MDVALATILQSIRHTLSRGKASRELVLARENAFCQFTIATSLTGNELRLCESTATSSS